MNKRLFSTSILLVLVLVAFRSPAEELQHMEHDRMQQHSDSVLHADHMQHTSPVQTDSSQQGHDNMTHHAHEANSGDVKSQSTDAMSYTTTNNKSLKMLDELPASGKSRENGFDGQYAMESNVHTESLELQCAKGSRGLIMLDNDTWQKCGGKPKGLPKTVNVSATNSTSMQHMEHMQH